MKQETFFEHANRNTREPSREDLERVADAWQSSYKMKREKALDLAKRTLCPPDFSWKK